MVDKVKPLKFENVSTGGTQLDFLPTEANPNEDYLVGKGIAFENSDSFLAEKVGGVLGFTIPSHSYKYNYSGDNLSSLEIFNGFTQTTINRIAKVDVTYTGNNVTAESWKIYSSDGTTILRTVTLTHSYSSDILIKTEEVES